MELALPHRGSPSPTPPRVFNPKTPSGSFPGAPESLRIRGRRETAPFASSYRDSRGDSRSPPPFQAFSAGIRGIWGTARGEMPPPREGGHPKKREGPPRAAPSAGAGRPLSPAVGGGGGGGGQGATPRGWGGTPRDPRGATPGVAPLHRPTRSPKPPPRRWEEVRVRPKSRVPTSCVSKELSAHPKARRGGILGEFREIWDVAAGRGVDHRLGGPLLRSRLDPNALGEIPLAFHPLFPGPTSFVPTDPGEAGMSLSLGDSHPPARAPQMLGQMLGET